MIFLKLNPELPGDVSIATANYLYRHGFQGSGKKQNKKKEIINYAELEKIEKYT